jgi:hypothetical protein
VIVPVLQRPANAAPLMASLRASGADAAAYAVCQSDDDDTAAAWLDTGAEVLDSGEQVSFAAKANLGYAKTSEPWLFLCGDDVRFHLGWLANALLVAGRVADVIGTNDLGNPRVVAGQHATHLLIRRAYVDTFGGGWDGPGILCHEGYRHWYVDDEIVTAARQRQVWAMARSAVVEHLHPAWGKAEMDPTYALGQVAAPADRQRFLARLAAYSPGAVL